MSDQLGDTGAGLFPPTRSDGAAVIGAVLNIEHGVNLYGAVGTQGSTVDILARTLFVQTLSTTPSLVFMPEMVSNHWLQGGNQHEDFEA